MGFKELNVFLDFETRSLCDLKKHGAWNYSIDPSTKVLCVSFAIDNGPTQLWFKDFPHLNIKCNKNRLDPLFDAIKKGAKLYAHNAFFEVVIWENVCVKKMGWPKVNRNQWRCTMAIASFYALPRGLEKLAETLNLPIKKDMLGNAAMKRVTIPNKKTGKFSEDKEDLIRTFKYCPIDVEVSREIFLRLGPLPKYELKIWQLSLKMNITGVLFDRKLAETARDLKNTLEAQANLDIYNLTGGAVKKTTTSKDYCEWTKKNGYDMTKKSLAKDVVPEYLTSDFVPEIIKESIRIKTSVSLSSINKYNKMLNLMSPEDDRVRNNFLYGGAGTLRFTSQGTQLQNLPKSYGEEMGDVCQSIKENEFEYIKFMYGDRPIEALKKSIRGAIIAPKGKELSVIDYSSVEARGLFWLIDDKEALETIKKSCIYCDLATSIVGYEVIKDVHNMERNLGKQAILGLGYQMWYIKFLATLRGYNIILGKDLVRSLVGEDYDYYKKMIIGDAGNIMKAGIDVKRNLYDLIGCRYIVNVYRTKYPLVKKFWYDCENGSIEAMLNPGKRVDIGKIYYKYDEETNFLQCFLPSGRPINYFDPKIKPKYDLVFTGESIKGRLVNVRISTENYTKEEYKTVEEMFRKRKIKLVSKIPRVKESYSLSYMKLKSGKFFRTFTYGGKQVENNTQGLCRDLLCNSMIRFDERGYPVVLTVHDELGSENRKGILSIDKVKSINNELPEWAEGFPVASEGFISPIYRK